LSSKVLKPPLALESRPVRVGGADAVQAPMAPDWAEQMARESAEAVEAMLARAREEARAILEQAEAEAGEVRQAARAAGYEEGARAAREEWDRAVTELQAAMAGPAERLAALLDVTSLLEEPRVLAAAAVLAEQVVGEALQDSARLVARAKLLVSAVAGERIRLYCAPEVAEQLQAAAVQLEAGLRTLAVLTDPTLQPGDLVAEGDGGGVDGSIIASLRHILEEVALGDDQPEPR